MTPILSHVGRDTSPEQVQRAGTRTTDGRQPVTVGDIRGSVARVMGRDELLAQMRQLREMRGVSQKGLAKKTGLVAAQIAQYEGGKYVPSWEVLVRIFDALDAELVIKLKEE